MLPHILKDYAASPDAPLTLHENRMFRVVFNGRFHYVEFLRHKSSAIIVPRFANGDFLLVRLPRAPIFGLSLEFPRGRVEPAEGKQDAASRELREETGYAIDRADFRHLGSIGPDTATLNERNEVFVVTIPEGSIRGTFDADEISEVLRFSEEAFKKLIRDSAVVDAQTLAAYALLCCRV